MAPESSSSRPHGPRHGAWCRHGVATTLQDLRRFTGFSTFFMVLRLFVASNNVDLQE